MSEAQPRAQQPSISLPDDSPDVTLENVGIEFEYPVGNRPNEMVCSASLSQALHDQTDRGQPWLDGYDGEGGRMTGEHTGSEIITGVLDLHSPQPENWYMETIQKATEMGHPFAATGWGSTSFGLHTHISYLDSDEADYIEREIDNEWSRVFFCASVSETSLDPWRHGSFATPPGQSMNRRGTPPEHRDNGRNHYEFRFPEPVHPDHFPLMMDFWRIVARDGAEAGVDFARELVHSRDERLTPIKQYRILEENLDTFPREEMFRSNRDGDPTDLHVAEWFHDLMDGYV